MMMDDDAKQQTVPLFILNKVLLLAINTEHILSFVAIFSSEKKSWLFSLLYSVYENVTY